MRTADLSPTVESMSLAMIRRVAGAAVIIFVSPAECLAVRFLGPWPGGDPRDRHDLFEDPDMRAIRPGGHGMRDRHHNSPSRSLEPAMDSAVVARRTGQRR